ncbi:hypothetical protein DP939_27365 [Spongiactinospora rosea]|uniref:ParB-like N-terminal domain-containing protein n=1 Tax=Spongiactinospora rosea TaxID=2248750 RepID=A0A366LU08_9ACTN|nr:hypothetical protein DP939_27365 [Spongiactinospora rosea]
MPVRALAETTGTSTGDGDELACGGTPRLTGVVMVPVGVLRSADSPRLGEMDVQHIRRLMAADPLPPIIVHRSTMRVIDGMHRLRAAVLTGRTEVNVRFFEGSDEDAFVVAVRTNVRHGLHLSAKERSVAAKRILISHPDWSDRAVAAAAGLSMKTVAEIRKRASEEIPHSHTRLGLDGRVRPVDAAAGRRRAAEYIQRHPQASLRMIASAAGVSTGTARDVRNRLARHEDPVPSGQRGGHVKVASRAGGDGPARAPVTAGGRGESDGRRRADPEHRVCRDALALLCRDPSLRFTKTGRMLLRMLDNRLLASMHRDQIIASIPPHSKDTILAAARQCIRVWQEFADEVTKDGGAEGAYDPVANVPEISY